jgi:peptide/nickel transport system substrate-binding protein
MSLSIFSRSRTGLAVLACSSLALVACGGGSDDGDGGGGSGPVNTTFTYTAVGAPSTFDIWSTYEGEASRANGFEWGSTLVEYERTDDACDSLQASDELRGNLAESWEYSADRSQLLITLREGVESAAGNPLTAEDVVWSMNRARELSSIVRFLTESVALFDKAGMFEAVDDRTVAVNVLTPTALDMAVFTWPQMTIMDSETVKANATAEDPLAKEWLKTNLANYGPWQVETFTPGSEVVYAPNPNFWDADNRGNIDKLVYRAVPDAATRLQLLEAGTADYAEKLAFDQYAQVEERGATQLINCASPNRDTLMLNQAFEPFADVEVRKAISQAIDREALVQGVYSGFANPAETGISQVYWSPGDDAETFEHDPEAAKDALAKAGVTNLAFDLLASPTRPGAHSQSLAVQIQSMLEQVGVTANIRVVPGATEFSNDFFAKKFEGVLYTEPPAVGDPFYSANLYNTTESFQNTFGYDNPEYDRLAKEIQTTEPGEERDELIREISDLMVETVPQAYLADTRYLHAFSGAVDGFQNNPAGSLLVYHMSKK